MERKAHLQPVQVVTTLLNDRLPAQRHPRRPQPRRSRGAACHRPMARRALSRSSSAQIPSGEAPIHLNRSLRAVKAP